MVPYTGGGGGGGGGMVIPTNLLIPVQRYVHKVVFAGFYRN